MRALAVSSAVSSRLCWSGWCGGNGRVTRTPAITLPPQRWRHHQVLMAICMQVRAVHRRNPVAWSLCTPGSFATWCFNVICDVMARARRRLSTLQPRRRVPKEAPPANAGASCCCSLPVCRPFRVFSVQIWTACAPLLQTRATPSSTKFTKKQQWMETSWATRRSARKSFGKCLEDFQRKFCSFHVLTHVANATVLYDVIGPEHAIASASRQVRGASRQCQEPCVDLMSLHTHVDRYEELPVASAATYQELPAAFSTGGISSDEDVDL